MCEDNVFLLLVGQGLPGTGTATTTTTIDVGAIMTTPGESEGPGRCEGGENRIIGHEILASDWLALASGGVW